MLPNGVMRWVTEDVMKRRCVLWKSTNHLARAFDFSESPTRSPLNPSIPMHPTANAKSRLTLSAVFQVAPCGVKTDLSLMLHQSGIKFFSKALTTTWIREGLFDHHFFFDFYFLNTSRNGFFTVSANDFRRIFLLGLLPIFYGQEIRFFSLFFIFLNSLLIPACFWRLSYPISKYPYQQ